MSAPSTSGLSVELLLRVIDVKYGCFTLNKFTNITRLILFSKKTRNRMELESLVITKFVLLDFCHLITVIKTEENVCVRIELTSN